MNKSQLYVWQHPDYAEKIAFKTQGYVTYTIFSLIIVNALQAVKGVTN